MGRDPVVPFPSDQIWGDDMSNEVCAPCEFLFVEAIPSTGSHCFLLISWCLKINLSQLANIYIYYVQIKYIKVTIFEKFDYIIFNEYNHNANSFVSEL